MVGGGLTMNSQVLLLIYTNADNTKERNNSLCKGICGGADSRYLLKCR